MDKKRKVYAPFSLTSEAGVAQTPVEGYIDVNQTIYPTVNTGTINENGTWAGVKSDDEDFIGFTKGENISNSGVIVFPDTNNFPSIDMTGFRTLQIAIKSSVSGNVAILAMMGPDTERFANLQPVDAGSILKFMGVGPYTTGTLDDCINDSSEAVTADAWNVFTFTDRLIGQKNAQIRIQNNTGSAADLELAFRRLV